MEKELVAFDTRSHEPPRRLTKKYYLYLVWRCGKPVGIWCWPLNLLELALFLLSSGISMIPIRFE